MKSIFIKSLKVIVIFMAFLLQQCNTAVQKTTVQDMVKPSIDFTSLNAIVYTTAHNSDLKLSITDTFSFSDFKQPLETEIDIVVDPQKEFQEFVGIGAALTDASAETFYKLTEENQALFLEAYYDVEKGIGYSLARTIIHS